MRSHVLDVLGRGRSGLLGNWGGGRQSRDSLSLLKWVVSPKLFFYIELRFPILGDSLKTANLSEQLLVQRNSLRHYLVEGIRFQAGSS